jgi:hypothetical protein
MISEALPSQKRVPKQRKGLTPDRMHDQQANTSSHYKQPGAPDRHPILFVQKARDSRSMSHSILILFTCAVPHTKIKGLLIDVPFYSYSFYTRTAAYKKQGTPD